MCFSVDKVGLWLVRTCGANLVELLQPGFRAPQMLHSEESVCLATSVIHSAVRVSGSSWSFIAQVSFVSNVEFWFRKVA